VHKQVAKSKKKVLTVICSECKKPLGDFKDHDKLRGSVACCKKLQNLQQNFESGFFIINVDFKFQVRRILENLEEQLKQPRLDNLKVDLIDGELYKSFPKNSLTFTMYCDRIPLSNSSRKGALPVLLFVNELSKSLRFKHPILCSIYVGELSSISEKSLLGYTSNILTQLENGLEYYSANFQQTKFKSCYQGTYMFL